MKLVVESEYLGESRIELKLSSNKSGSIDLIATECCGNKKIDSKVLLTFRAHGEIERNYAAQIGDFKFDVDGKIRIKG